MLLYRIDLGSKYDAGLRICPVPDRGALRSWSVISLVFETRVIAAGQKPWKEMVGVKWFSFDASNSPQLNMGHGCHCRL